MATKIEDVGEQLAFNRRNRIARALGWDDLSKLAPALRATQTTKVKIWPKPPYEELVEEGMDPLAARLLKWVYDSVAAKPGSAEDASLQAYVAAVERVRDAITTWARSPAPGELAAAMDAAAQARTTEGRAQVRRLMAEMIFIIWPETRDMPSWPAYFGRAGAGLPAMTELGIKRFFSGAQVTPDDLAKMRAEIEAGWPASREAWQVKGYRVVPRGDIRLTSATNSGVQKFCLIRDSLKGEWPRVIPMMTLIADGLATKDEALALAAATSPFLLLDKNARLMSQHATEEEAAVAARLLLKPDADVVARKVAVSRLEKMVSGGEDLRQGPDRRGGHDITPQQLMDTFGFRGVNFGNWVPDAERQAHLNASYEAFMDLADVMGVDLDVISLGGRLGLAIGAQGSGKFAGHFVPGLNDVNFTRTAGAGVAAHEWGHAFDHTLAELTGRYRGADAYFSERGVGALVREGGTGSDAMARILESMARQPATLEKREEAAELEAARWRNRLMECKAATSPAMSRAFLPLMSRLLKEGVASDQTAKIGRTRSLGTVCVADEVATLFTMEQTCNPRGGTYLVELFYSLDLSLAKIYKARNAEDYKVKSRYSLQSIKADSEKGGKAYWSTPCEMFARAFSDWVRAELGQRGIRNDYLAPAHYFSVEDCPLGDVPMPYLDPQEQQKVFPHISSLAAAFREVSPQLKDRLQAQRSAEDAVADADAECEEHSDGRADVPRG